MYAVIKTGGKQYLAAPGKEIKVEKVVGGVGEAIAFEKVLLTSDDGKVDVGQPFLENVRVIGKITRQGKERKVVVFKYKRRKNYRKKRGHSQEFTQVKIEEIK